MDKKIINVWIRNDFPETVNGTEFIGPLKQSTFIDPIDNTGFVHKGQTVEEMIKEGKVGIYKSFENWRNNERKWA